MKYPAHCDTRVWYLVSFVIAFCEMGIMIPRLSVFTMWSIPNKIACEETVL